MALPYETPARVWRRIEEGEEHGEEMPSLPSFPGLDDSISEKSSISITSSSNGMLDEAEPEFRNVTARKRSQLPQKGPPPLSMTASSRSASSSNSTPGSPDTSAEGRELSHHSSDISVHDPEERISYVSKTVRFSSLEPVSEVSVEESFDDRTEKAISNVTVGVRALEASEFDMPLDEDEHLPPIESSPAPSTRFGNSAFTPKAIPSRVQRQDQSPGIDVMNEDPATPFPHKRSFLMNIINSTSHPRLVNPTPHPRSKPRDSIASIGPIESTPASGRFPPIRVGRGRGRLSHPLTQVHTFNPQTPSTLSEDTETEEVGTPGANNSFVSTASSHDLTVHLRANASFDPVMGLQGQGVGRFNAGKLNTYLHGLNRRLQEENEILVKTLKQQQEECLVLREKLIANENTIGMSENSGSNGSFEEKDALQTRINELQNTLTTKEEEFLKLQADLKDERDERSRDKERWKDRMAEVERGVGEIVRDLEIRLREAEGKIEEQGNQVNEENIKYQTLVDECTELREKIALAEEELKANDGRDKDVRTLLEEKSAAQREGRELREQVQRLGAELVDERAQGEDKDKELRLSKVRIDDLQIEVDAAQVKVNDLEESIHKLEDQLDEYEVELKSLKRCKIDLESSVATAEEKIELLQEQLSNMNDELAESKAELEQAEDRLHEHSLNAKRSVEAVRELEEALGEKDGEVEKYLQEIADLRSKVSSFETRSREMSSVTEVDRTNGSMEALQEELCAANREIGRLTALLTHSPAQKALVKAKDERIMALEKETEDLLMQLQILKDKSMATIATPKRRVSFSGVSPMYRQLMNMTLRTPRTPGEPLKDVSWLHTTMDISTSPLVAEIDRLQAELDQANESIDDKIDRLEEVGAGVVGLTRELERARSTIVELEEHVANMLTREQSHARRLRNFKCSCGKGMPAHVLIKVVSENEQTDTMSSLLSEESLVNGNPASSRSALQDVADRLNAEILQTREQLQSALRAGKSSETVKAELQRELTKAKSTISDLEDLLTKERSKLRKAASEESHACRERDKILVKLRTKESDMDEAKKQLQELKLRNKQLEADINCQTKDEHRPEKLEDKLFKNKHTIEKLRNERSRLANEHAKLQRNLVESTKQIHELAVKHAALQCSYDNRRQLLDLQAGELDELRLTLLTQSNQLKDIHSEKKRVQAERSDLQAIISNLEADLQRVRWDAENYGRDLRKLKRQKEDAETKYKTEQEHLARIQKQSKAQICLLKEQLKEQKMAFVGKASRETISSIGNEGIEDLKNRHNKECKGLFIQIRYLKAKFVREATLRSDLTYQKQYLLVLLARYERSEKKIIACIAQIGFPKRMLSSPTRKKKLRSYAQAVIFLFRTRRASQAWREQCIPRSAVLDALDVVRRNRITE